MLTMTLSVVHNYGFFTPMAVALTLLFLFITVMLFGGTPGQKFTACLINGTMCLLVENSMRYVISWILKCELQQVIQRADCLIIIAVANMVVGAAVAQAQCTGALAGADHELFSGRGRGAEHPAHAHR